jgi:hypothetical protein
MFQRSNLLCIILLVIGMLFTTTGCSSSGGGSNSTSASLTNIQVTPVNSSISLNGVQQFTATGTFSDGSTQNLTTQVSWATNPANIAAINTTGQATGNAAGSTTVSASMNGVNGSTSLSVAATPVIPDPPADDAQYFQIMIVNLIGSEHTVHLTATANQMTLNPPPDIEKITWLTGGGTSFNDWTQPVFQIVDSTSGSSATGADFLSTYDFTLDMLPLDSTGQFCVLKIPFLMPGDSTRSLGGSGHLTITLDKAATMQINTAASAAGFAFALPSPDPNGAGGQDRWDFLEFNNATPMSSNKNVSYIDTTNVDFFSLGITIKGRTDVGALSSFGLDLSIANPVANAINELKNLTGSYANGLVNSTSSGQFLRFQGADLAFLTGTPTDLDNAITSGYNYYMTNTLQFDIAGDGTFIATSDGNTLTFTSPVSFTIAKPTSYEVVAAKGPLDVSLQSSSVVQDGIKFVDAYLNRGVFEDTSVWLTPAQWYPAGVEYNQYALLLHQLFIDGATYGFSFDDVPAQGITSAPAIDTCTSMTLVLTDE